VGSSPILYENNYSDFIIFFLHCAHTGACGFAEEKDPSVYFKKFICAFSIPPFFYGFESPIIRSSPFPSFFDLTLEPWNLN